MPSVSQCFISVHMNSFTSIGSSPAKIVGTLMLYSFCIPLRNSLWVIGIYTIVTSSFFGWLFPFIPDRKVHALRWHAVVSWMLMPPQKGHLVFTIVFFLHYLSHTFHVPQE